MKWVSKIFITAIILLLGFVGYRLQTVKSSSATGEKFRRLLENRAPGNEPSVSPSIQELPEKYRVMASELGFEQIRLEPAIWSIRRQTLEDDSLTIGKFNDRWLLLNFWTTWCVPCREELPSLASLQQKLRKHPFEVLLVNVMENEQNVGEFLSGRDISLTVFLDNDGRLTDEFGVKGIPASFLIGPGGSPVLRLQGSYEWDEDTLYEFLNQVSQSDEI